MKLSLAVTFLHLWCSDHIFHRVLLNIWKVATTYEVVLEKPGIDSSIAMTTWLKSYNARILIKRQADDKIILSSACLYHIWRYPLVYPLVSLGNLNLSSAHHLYMEMKVNKLKYQWLIYVLKLNRDLLHSLIYLNCFPHHSEEVCASDSGIFTGGGLIPSADSTMLGRFLDKIDPLGGAQVPPVPTHIRSDSYGKFKICLKHHPGPHKGPQPTWTLTAPNQTLQQDVGCSSESVPRFTWENLNRGHQWWEKVQGWIFWEFWWTASGHQTTSEGPVVLHPRVKAGTLFEREPVGDRIITFLNSRHCYLPSYKVMHQQTKQERMTGTRNYKEPSPSSLLVFRGNRNSNSDDCDWASGSHG